jgi:hypothetical protein
MPLGTKPLSHRPIETTDHYARLGTETIHTVATWISDSTALRIM